MIDSKCWLIFFTINILKHLAQHITKSGSIFWNIVSTFSQKTVEQVHWYNIIDFLEKEKIYTYWILFLEFIISNTVLQNVSKNACMNWEKNAFNFSHSVKILHYCAVLSQARYWNSKHRRESQHMCFTTFFYSVHYFC